VIIQIINLSFKDVFHQYSEVYKFDEELFRSDALALEIREISEGEFRGLSKALYNSELLYYKNEEADGGYDLLIVGSIKNFKYFSLHLEAVDAKLNLKVQRAIKNFEGYYSKSYKIGDKEFKFEKAYVMGILNVTPDSFSDGGLYENTNDAVEHGLQMIELGADIIDVGGESTRPGAEPVPVEVELKRVIPVIKKILSKQPDSIISVDTTKSKVAREALLIGAKIINDISGLTFDPLIKKFVVEFNAAVILMHIKGIPKTMQKKPFYEDVIQEIHDFLYKRIEEAINAGIKEIFIDPGIGFGKRLQDNFDILKRLGDFKSLGFPILVGVSRKSFLGKTLDLDVEKRDAASVVVESLAIKNGARIIRTHNVEYGVQVCKLLNNLS